MYRNSDQNNWSNTIISTLIPLTRVYDSLNVKSFVNHHKTMKRIITKSWQSVSWLREFLQEAPDWRYVIQEWKDTRWNRQNRMYWALLNFAEEQTWTNDDVYHEYFKRTHTPKARKKRLQCLGKVFYKNTELTTTTMKTDEFSKYYTKCEQDLAVIGVILPDKNSPEYENFLLSYS